MAGADEREMSAIAQAGVEYVSLGMRRADLSYDFIIRERERLASFGLSISDLFCPELQKNKIIHLGLEGREGEIDAFCDMLSILGRASIPFTSIAWQPDGILRTSRSVGKHTRGGISFICEEDEVLSRGVGSGRVYSEEEIWENFLTFCSHVIPVAEECKVRLALHPNDPPLRCMTGVPSLIWNSECYRKAFALVPSPALGMKFCIGCWLEGGEAFGDLASDIREFAASDRILCVHFRNTSSTLPSFEETLLEDGYADMYAIMKELVRSGSDAVISIDHGFAPIEGFGGMTGSFLYSTGYMKGLMHAAMREIGARSKANLFEK